MNKLTQLDLKMLHKIQEKICRPELDSLMRAASLIGTAGAVWLGIGGALMLTKKYRRQGFILAAAVVTDVVANNLLVKNIFSRPRPCDVDKSVALKVKRPIGASFPSGHTLTSVTAATILAMTNKRFGLCALPLAGLISFSRMYLFVHYPSDIAAATAMGIGFGTAAFKLGDKLLPNPKAKA